MEPVVELLSLLVFSLLAPLLMQMVKRLSVPLTRFGLEMSGTLAHVVFGALSGALAAAYLYLQGAFRPLPDVSPWGKLNALATYGLTVYGLGTALYVKLVKRFLGGA